jgi:hypothetical protein
VVALGGDNLLEMDVDDFRFLSDSSPGRNHHVARALTPARAMRGY